MRHLNRVIFVNSGNIRYEEFRLDGNIHLSGSSGAGKTSILRAFVYFFTADRMKLGIDTASQKKDFIQFYFPSPDSHIIYEVKRENDSFCVILSAYNHVIQFGFVDGVFDRNWIVNPANGVVAGSWGEITKRIPTDLDRDLIKTNKEYLDILWGCSPNKRYSRYALAHCHGYENMLKSIKNYWLGSGFSTEAFKHNIIYYLSENAPTLNLKVLRKQLEHFQEEIADIALWYSKDSNGECRIRNNADEVVSNYLVYCENERQLRQSLCELRYAVEESQKRLPLLKESLKKTEEDLAGYNEELGIVKSEASKKKESLDRLIGEIEGQLKIVAEKKRKYADIGKIMNLASQEESILSELSSLVATLNTLRQENLDVENQYKEILLNLESGYNKSIAEIDLAINEMIEKDNEARQAAIRVRESARNTVDRDYHEQSVLKQREISKARTEKESVSEEIAVTKAKRFYGDEIQQAKDEIASLKQQLLTNERQIEQDKARDRELRAIAAREEEKIEATYIQAKKEYDASKSSIDSKLKKIEEYLSKYSQSAYRWLQDNCDGWQDNIGKVVDCELLYRTDLSPELEESSSHSSAYGVKLTLDNVQRKIYGPEDYEQEKQSLETALAELAESIRDAAIRNESDKTSIRELLKKETRPLQTHIAELGLATSQITSKIGILQSRVIEFQNREEAEKKQCLEVLNARLCEKTERLDGLESELAELGRTKDAKIEAINAEYQKTFESLANSLADFKAAQIREKDSLTKNYNVRRAEIESQKNEVLAGKGVDVVRLKTLEQDILCLEQKKASVSEAKKKIAVYLNDKKEWLDHEADFLESKKQKESELDSILRSSEQHISALSSEIGRCEEQKRQLEEERAGIVKGISKYEQFRNMIEASDVATETSIAPIPTDASLEDILEKFITCNGQREPCSSNMKRAINRFKGMLHSSIIQLPQIKDGRTEEFIAYAESLREFLENNLIDQISSMTNNNYIHLLHSIRMSMGRLLELHASVHDIILDIDKTFRTSKLPGVIKKIEIEDRLSKNDFFECLCDIKTFVDEYEEVLPGVSLWVTEEQFEEAQKKMNRLLSRFVGYLTKDPSYSSMDEFSVENMFDIYFSIVENNNSVGPVRNLPAEIGSGGTTLMIKLMINAVLIEVSVKRASKKQEESFIHLVLDESSRISCDYWQQVLDFVNEKNIYLILGTTENPDPLSFRRNYLIYKENNDPDSHTRKHLLVENNE